MLAHDGLRQLFKALLHLVLQTEQVAAAGEGSRLAPILKGLLRRPHGGVDFPGRRKGNPRNHLIYCGIAHVQQLGGLRFDPLAINVILEHLDLHVRLLENPDYAARNSLLLENGTSTSAAS